MKKLSGKFKHVNRGHALVIVFLFFIFYVGSAALPVTVKNIAEQFKGEAIDVSATVAKIDDGYRGMLDFRKLNFRNKGAYINLNGLMARVMGQRSMNGIVKLDNGHLLLPNTQKKDPALSATQLIKLYGRQEEKGKAFLFVLAPTQNSKSDDIMSVGYKDYSNQNADALLDALRGNGVPILDLRDEMAKGGLGHSDSFFVTDHHWKPETGFWAYTKMADYMTRMEILPPIDAMLLDIDSYDIETYKKIFLGSSGKRTGSYYAGVDDIAIITPKFDTFLSVVVPSKAIDKCGDFAEVAYDMAAIKYGYFLSDPYRAYAHGDKAYIRFENELAPNELKILCVGDSFARSSCIYLPLISRRYDAVDMRHFDGDFLSYYDDFSPDIIIVFVNPDSINEPNTTYDFFDDLNE